uniref:Response regulatory domain-containing protein n=1 Tax=Araucaria cunninghamii TaxID=56994 RepID=A0A0D6R118_ARACU
MTTGKSAGDGKSKQPAQGVPKQVKFVVNLESDSECVQKGTFYEISDKGKFGHGDGSTAYNSSCPMDIKGVLSSKDIQVRRDGQGLNCISEMSQQKQEAQKEVRGGIMGDGQELSEEDESRNNELVDGVVDEDWQLPADANDRLQGAALPQKQPQPQGPVIRWERFLEQRSLRVLLVENDDSTRQVVSALLRNCSYEVTAVANGQQAWKLLEDPSNHFDLVLTEVVMPCLSGIGLLCKIMSHQPCKNIPVIMMSSHDSMGIVFKCLSKGAVDFLVKPVRKNELKNLWQHVWRRCHSSSGSGSETGSQTKRFITPNSDAEPDNNTGSNDESDDASIGLSIRDGSDNGSGTQSSWTKRAVEVESPRHRSEWDLGRSHNSTIGQVIQPNIGTAQNEWMPLAGTSRECQDEKPYDYEMGQDLEIAVPGQTEAHVEHHQDNKALCDKACAREESPAPASSAEAVEIEETVGTNDSPDEIATKAADLIGTIASKPESRNLEVEDNGSREALEKGLNTQIKDKTVADFRHLPFLELTLKRSRTNGEEDGEPEDRHVLRQSGCSAFSRYNTGSTQVSHPSGDSFQPNLSSKGYGLQRCMTSGSLATGKPGSLRATVPIERVGSSKGSGGDKTPTPVQNQLSQSSNNQDLGSSVVGPSGQDMFPMPMQSKDDMGSATTAGQQKGKPMSMHPGVMSFDAVPAVYGSGVHPMYYSHTGPPLWASEAQHANERGEMCNNSTQTEQQIVGGRVHHHHHHVQHVHHHHHHHQSHQYKHASEHPNKNEHVMNNVGVTAPLCGSSNMVGCAPDGNNGQSGSNNGYGSNGNGNGSVNGSASGSNNGSNGQNGHSNGQSSAALTPGTNGESDTGIAVKSSAGGGGGGGSGSGSGSASGVDQNRSAQREAALTKFRQKRKERCFEKKVRYQSRKRLAEQRPRVRGQFVRQTVYEPTSGEAD